MDEPRALRVAVHTLGCKVNRSESESIAEELLGAGAQLVEQEAADIVVVNSCTVTGEADAKVRKAIRHALAGRRAPLVVVTGCLATLDADGLSALGERVLVEADKARVAGRVAAVAGTPPARGGLTAQAPRPLTDPAFRTRAAVKIEDGCDAFCTYCIVPHARGLPTAVPLDEVESRVRALVDQGVREVVLTGINIGRYDDDGRGLGDVIRTVAATGVTRVRLSSVEPPDLTERLLATMADTPAFCAHLHVPLQAGSDAVLAAMGRAYDTAEYRERIGLARSALPGLVVTTDVLAGFPGETGEQARETLEFCREVGFSKLHVFRYSRRRGTPAAERLDQVAETTKTWRAEALRALSSSVESAHAASAVGTVAEVLVERVRGTGAAGALAEGTSRDYLRVKFTAADASPGDVERVMVERAEGRAVFGTRVH